jgi:hypothetical protein
MGFQINLGAFKMFFKETEIALKFFHRIDTGDATGGKINGDVEILISCHKDASFKIQIRSAQFLLFYHLKHLFSILIIQDVPL